MKVLYITNVFGASSETFINDLVDDLQKKTKLTLLCNKRLTRSMCDYEVIVNKKNYKINKLRIIEKLINVFTNNPFNLVNKWKNIFATSILKKVNPDVAFIDFGLNACEYSHALKKLSIPYIVHFHGLDITSALSSSIYRNELIEIFMNASGIIVASNHIKRLLIMEGCPEYKIYLVRLSISTEETVQKPWHERKKLPPRISFVGRLTPKKNPVALILMLNQVIKTIPNVCLDIIGEGMEKYRVVEFIKRFNLQDSVKIHGALPRKKALEIINNSQVYVQHSVTPHTGDQEGWALTLSEAALLGLPIVSTLHNGIPENVDNEMTGYLVQEYDYEAMAEKVLDLLMDLDLAEKMGNAGKKKFTSTSEYTIEHRSNKILSILQDLRN